MDRMFRLVRWRRYGVSRPDSRRFYTKWHVMEPSFHDDRGETACGREFDRQPQEKMEQVPEPDVIDGDSVCASCKAAIRKAPDRHLQV